MKKVLVIAAHPDDEVLGCGGTLLKHLKYKDQINIVFTADGHTSRNNGKNRIKNFLNVKNFLKIKNYFFLNFEDNQMDKVSLLSVVKKIEKIILKIKPDIIYTHYPEDLNIDHQITSKATITASRLFKNKFIKKILFFEIPSSTEQSSGMGKSFLPSYFVNIENYISNKIKLCKFYNKEFKKFPFPRSYETIKNLAKYRGSIVGKKYVEAFEVFRILK